MNEKMEINLENENDRLRRIIERVLEALSLESVTETKKLQLVRVAIMEKDGWRTDWVSEREEAPLEFACSGCDKKVVRDSFTYYASIPAPDYARQCPTCGHVPSGWFHYCSPECLAKAFRYHPFVRLRREKEEVERIMTSKGVDREIAWNMYMKRRGFVRTETGSWAKPGEKPTFHKDFPRQVKSQGFRVYMTGWPDYLIEKDGNYVAVEVKDRSGLTDGQKLMHQALERAGLRVLVVTPETMDLLGARENTQ